MKPVYAKPIKFVPIKKSQLHKDVRGVNLRLYNAAMKAIADEPSQFDMQTWYAGSILDTKGNLIHAPNCGTTACFGGWAMALSKRKNPKEASKVIRRSFGTEALAQRALKLPVGHSDRLFVHTEWPDDWGYDYEVLAESGHHRRAAQVALKRFKHYLLTGK